MGRITKNKKLALEKLEKGKIYTLKEGSSFGKRNYFYKV